MINVTQTYLPPFDEYVSILKRAWENKWITNNGELVQELESKLKDEIRNPQLLFCTNGTIVLQMAIKALGITKEIITTPFSYVATTNAIVWEKCTPVFVDIDPLTFCIDANKIEEKISDKTEAILATHVYGFPCEIEKIEAIAKKHNLKVIYDAAHAFGCLYKGSSLLNYGDIATCSFHATKIFHTVEGGCIVAHSDDTFKKLTLYRSFGHIADDYFTVGVNGKNSEFHAAMGLAVFPHLHEIIKERKRVTDIYNDVERTATSFIQNSKSSFTQVMYKTGDLVELGANGYLYFKGRIDNQVKHMGYRIELEEIEAAFSTLNYVDEVGVIYEKISAELGQIKAFISIAAPQIDEQTILSDIKNLLPPYMIPRKIVILPILPKNSNGKIDRKQLALVK